MEPITYQLVEEDLVRFHLYYAETSGVMRKARNQARIWVPLAYLVFALLSWLSDMRFVAVALLVFAVAWFFIYPLRVRSRYRRHYEKMVKETRNRAFGEPSTVELAPDGIIDCSELGEMKFRYRAVEQIVEHEGYTYIFVGKAMAIILPHDRVPKAAIDALVAEIARRKAAAQTAEVPVVPQE